MNRLYILYDANCAMCRHCRQWLDKQPAYFKLRFIPFQSPQLEYRFPGVRRFHPEERLVVISDKGAVYQGAGAWIMCLYALKEYREWSQRLASPALMPFARTICEMVSENRKLFSEWFFTFNNEQLAAELSRKLPSARCSAEGGCRKAD